MRKFLLFSSMVLLLCHCALARGNDIPDWPDSCVVDSWEYNILIQARGNNVTGLCLMNLYPDSSIIGTVVNDFGVKVLDFTYAKGKARVMNVFGPINKWYIRRVLRGDFAFILANLRRGEDVVAKKRRLTIMPNGDIQVANERYKINYVFSQISCQRAQSSLLELPSAAEIIQTQFHQ